MNPRHRDDDMDTYAVRLPRWPILVRLLGRDPLVRTTDRVEALVSVLTVVVTLLAVPIAAAIGTELYDTRRHAYAAGVPTTTNGAAVEAVTIAFLLWVGFAAAAASLITLTRAVCQRIRFDGWQHAVDSLVGSGDGRTTNQP